MSEEKDSKWGLANELAPVTSTLMNLESLAKTPEYLKEINLGTYIGVCFIKTDGVAGWAIGCPCGVTVKYPINGLPEIDTPHPCGNPNHWTVKFYEDNKNDRA